MKRLVASVFLVILFSSSISIAEIDQSRQVMIESRIVVVNHDSLVANIMVTPIGLDGESLSSSAHSIPAKGSLRLDGGTLGLQPGFSGSLKLESDRPIVGMEYSVYSDPQLPVETNRGLTSNRLLSSSELDQKVYLPLVQNSNGTKSYIAVQNAGSVNTDIVIDFHSESSTRQIIAQAILAGATRLIEAPANFQGSAVVTSSDTDIAVLSETINFEKGSASVYDGIPDADAVAQREKSFVWNLDATDSLLTKIVMMNVSANTQGGSVLFRGDSDPDWEAVDCPGILPYHGVTVAPPAAATWQVGLGILTLIPKQASIGHTTNVDQGISFSTGATDYPAMMLDTWYIPHVTDKTEIDLFHDDAISTDFKITYKHGANEQTENFTLDPYVHHILSSPLPDDTEGYAIIENLSAWPTGLAIEVKDKKDAGDFSAYVPAYIASTVLFAPWFSYQYHMRRSPILYPLIYLLLLNNQ
jgi:hypothetical protein